MKKLENNFNIIEEIGILKAKVTMISDLEYLKTVIF